MNRFHADDDDDAPRFLAVLPNLVTLLGLCAGLTSIRFTFGGNYELAAALIIVGAFIDGLDGQLARRLKATSDFGAELDSLCDFLNFGVAPGLLVYEYLLGSADGAGWAFVLIYITCCCMRLARFNVAKKYETLGERDPGVHFVGVPAPAGALLCLLPVFLTFEGIADAAAAPVVTALYIGLVGVAMVSRLPTISPKSVSIPKEKALWVLGGTAVVAGALLVRFWVGMVLIDLAYAGTLIRSGIVTARNHRNFNRD